ncbi:DUF4157 domain-containing protein [Pseudonocardia sp. CA-142604]|uniref:eCIS core domain-containing protein n=1 Tax=Pseudonocardia sp. CA-142604 TaxID=3240024 RepID=UPI003D90A854
MRDQDNRKATGHESQRAPACKSVTQCRMPLMGLMALQRSVGNAAVVEMLRRARHPGAQGVEGRHQHGLGQSEEPEVQRSAVHDVLRSGGRPLDDSTRTDMERRFGEDFSDVRIHDDHAAESSAAELGARAYTSGSHVVIGSGGADRHTLAHELSHVVQQRWGAVAGTDNGSGLKVSDPSDRFERAAETHAIRVMRSATASSTAATGPEPIDAAPMDSELTSSAPAARSLTPHQKPAMAPVVQGSPTAHSGVPDQAVAPSGGAIAVQRAVGVELETGFAVSPPPDMEYAGVVEGPRIGDSGPPTFVIDFDTFQGNHIIEIVSTPTTAMTGERSRADRKQTFSAIDEAVRRLKAAGPGATLKDIFPASEGYVVDPAFADVPLVEPTGGMTQSHRYAQYTVGVPLSGVYDVMAMAQSGMTEGAETVPSFVYARKNDLNALAFADRVAAKFAGLRTSLDRPPEEQSGQGYDQDLADSLDDRSHLRDVAELRGFMAVAAAQVGARLSSLVRAEDDHDRAVKNHTLVASRTSLAAMRGALSDEVKKFLKENRDSLAGEFESSYRAAFSDLVTKSFERRGIDPPEPGQLLKLSVTPGGKTAEAYLDNALRQLKPGKQLDQYEMLGVRTNSKRMDDDLGNREVPMALLELRLFGGREGLSVDQLGKNTAMIADRVRAADDAARAGRPVRPSTRLNPPGRLGIVSIPFEAGVSVLRDLQTKLVSVLAGQVAERAVQPHAPGSARITIDVVGFASPPRSLVRDTAKDTGQRRAEAVEGALRAHIAVALAEIQPPGTSEVATKDVRITTSSGGRGDERVDVHLDENRA